MNVEGVKGETIEPKKERYDARLPFEKAMWPYGCDLCREDAPRHASSGVDARLKDRMTSYVIGTNRGWRLEAGQDSRRALHKYIKVFLDSRTLLLSTHQQLQPNLHPSSRRQTKQQTQPQSCLTRTLPLSSRMLTLPLELSSLLSAA